MRRKPHDVTNAAFGSRVWFQMVLDGGPERTTGEQGWENAVQCFRSWLDKRGTEAQVLSSIGKKKINQHPWDVPRWKLNRAVRRLPRGYREIFEMHERLGYTHKDIAEHLDCSVGTSKSQLHKARRRLRQSLQRKRPSKIPQT